jgi:outer membrane protein TolC
MARRSIGLVASAAVVLLLGGCASVSIDEAIEQSNQTAPGFTQGQLVLARNEDERQARVQLAQQLLTKPLSMDDAVRLALANSPALQALLAQSWSEIAQAGQSGRIANPIFSFERMRLGEELELGRLLSIGLLDLLTLSQRASIARSQVAQARTQLSINVVEQVSLVRQAWVRAVAAQQLLAYAQQVHKAARASAELARRMAEVGNFSKLQRARQHAFYADAAAQLASASHAATAAREELVRQLGLTEAQAEQLKLPGRLPDLPKEPRAPGEVSATATAQRLDVQLARQQLDSAGRAQGLELINSLLDVEVGRRHDTVFDNAEGHRANRNGWELEVRLPLFDWGGARHASMNAQSLAAANRYDAVTRAASSQLRESYSGYRAAYDLARHYRDEIVPLRKTMSEENVLRYNGMLIGVFELLADTRDQIASVMAAINAEQQFWLADAGLAATLIGKPTAMVATPVSTSTTSNPERGH